MTPSGLLSSIHWNPTIIATISAVNTDIINYFAYDYINLRSVHSCSYMSTPWIFKSINTYLLILLIILHIILNQISNAIHISINPLFCSTSPHRALDISMEEYCPTQYLAHNLTYLNHIQCVLSQRIMAERLLLFWCHFLHISVPGSQIQPSQMLHRAK